MITNLKQQESQLSEQQVVEFLSQNPHFFQNHLPLLESMSLPHPSGQAISLISKQLEIYRNRHHNMEEQLNMLIEIARENDTVNSRMHELNLAMLDSATLQEALTNLQEVLHECFLADYVAVKIFQEEINPEYPDLFVSPNDEGLLQFNKILSDNTPKCSRPTLTQTKFLFGKDMPNIESCAFVPLTFTKLEGLLVIGSRQKNRYTDDMGKLFLTQMSEIVATRLISLQQEKAVNLQ